MDEKIHLIAPSSTLNARDYNYINALVGRQNERINATKLLLINELNILNRIVDLIIIVLLSISFCIVIIKTTIDLNTIRFLCILNFFIIGYLISYKSNIKKCINQINEL